MTDKTWHIDRSTLYTLRPHEGPRLSYMPEMVNDNWMQVQGPNAEAVAREIHASLNRPPLPSRRLYLDLDGVMADFDAHFPAVFDCDHRSMADDAMWERINSHNSFFRDLPPCPGALEFFRAIAHLDPIILTACPRTNYAAVAGQKRAWVREHLGDLVVLPVMGGRNKPLFMHAPGDVLIDDWSKNIEAWTAAGGSGILHRHFPTTLDALSIALAPVAA